MATRKNKSSASLAQLVTELQASVDSVYSNELKMDASKNIGTLQTVPWLGISGNDSWAREKSWFALTIGRASFKRKVLLDEEQAAKALGMKVLDVAPGYYLMDPNGKVAAAYISDMHGGRDVGYSAWKIFETKTLEAMEASGAVSDETFITKIEVDPKLLMSRSNQFADAMGIDFDDGALDRHGISVKTKRLDELWMTGADGKGDWQANGRNCPWAWQHDSVRVGVCI